MSQALKERAGSLGQHMVLYKLVIIAALSLAAFVGLSAKDKTTTDQPGSSDSSKADSIVWMTYNEAIARATAEDKHVFIHFTTKTCGWCRRMERTTYKDPDVIRMLNGNFAPVKVWADSRKQLDFDGYKITEQALAREEFGVTGYPEYWFVTPEKTKVGPLKGFLQSERFIRALTYVKDYQYDTTRTKSESQGGSEGK